MDKLMSLRLIMHYAPQNKGLLIFKSLRHKLSINYLKNGLQFIANMKQLSMAVLQQGAKDCAYELCNDKGKEWILNCRLKKNMVDLEIWFQKHGFNEQLETVFNWQGQATEFIDAVNLMINKAGRYKFFVH